ncbi:pteridine reductase [Flavobacterium sp. W21_SRS_FM6]|uniref:pteridine reductase n=1 Tax=Flavobacterium sp. W21_SRS_FM6 TaxID=3240268 RepID=UPI003F8D97C1
MSPKVMLVTGGAKRIGATTVQYFHQLGWNIVLHFNHSKEQALALSEELNAGRANSVKVVQGSLSTIADTEAVAVQAINAYGKLDALVNNASAFYPTPIGSITENDWLNLVGSNMQAPLFLAQYCTPSLQQNNGAIINMVDIHASHPLRSHTLYCMAKSALITMTQSLAQELAPKVRVNGIAPGAILWPESSLLDEEKEKILKQIPLQKLGSMIDIAKGIEYLVNASYVTGQILTIDGGRSIASNEKA